jgi:hypothetical protein
MALRSPQDSFPSLSVSGANDADKATQQIQSVMASGEHLLKVLGENGFNQKEIDLWVEQTQKSILALTPNPQKHLTTELIKGVKPLKFFEPEQQPQDFDDLISETVRVFFEQIEEVTREVKEINKKHLKVHVMMEAEKQVKQDYMRQLVKKQRELMM